MLKKVLEYAGDYRKKTYQAIATMLIVQSNVKPFCTRKSSCSIREPEPCCYWLSRR